MVEKEFCRRCTLIHADEFRISALSERIIRRALRALNTLGADPAHTEQRINYLQATGLHLCLLLNTGRPHREIHRVAHEL
jgi:hypothetical protein